MIISGLVSFEGRRLDHLRWYLRFQKWWSVCLFAAGIFGGYHGGMMGMAVMVLFAVVSEWLLRRVKTFLLSHTAEVDIHEQGLDIVEKTNDAPSAKRHYSWDDVLSIENRVEKETHEITLTLKNGELLLLDFDETERAAVDPLLSRLNAKSLGKT